MRERRPADRVVSYTAAAITGVAIVVLAGWLFDSATLRTIAPVWSAMAPVTAILLILFSAALYWEPRRPAWSNLALAACAAIAAAVFVELLFDVHLGVAAISRILDGRPGTPAPELPDAETAMAMLLLIGALLGWRTRFTRVHDFADLLVVVIGLICLQILFAYTYNVIMSSSWSGFRQIAPHTTISIMMLAFAATTLRPTVGLYAATQGDAQSALQLKRLLPATIVFVAIVGWLHTLAVRERVVTEADLIAWTGIAAISGLALLMFITSSDMRRAEAAIRSRQEELIAAKTKAEAASEAKSRFMAVMSHELRTPLTAVIGYANLLDEGLSPETHAEARGYTERIRASGWQLVGLIDAVLMFAGGQAPATENRQQRVDLRELAESIARGFLAEANRKGLSLHIAAEAPVWVITDLQKLRQLLTTLLSNAVKFTDSGGIEVRLRVDAQSVVIDIADTGIGISSQDLSHIWEAFQQVDGSHTRERGGMGLGLALARQLAAQIGAELTTDSAAGQGSTFSVRLPRGEAAGARIIDLSGTRLLVVDDEAGVRRIMARTLHRYGGVVIEAESAHQALECAHQHGAFDVVITDISMPGMTGIQLAQQLAARRSTVPVLFVTGAELDASDYAAIAALHGQLLRKPFDMVELAKTVQLLAGRG